jgi:hypothetical protein
MWFGTPNGVSLLSRGGWRRATIDGLPSNDVNTIVEDTAGNVWIGTAADCRCSRRPVQRGLALPSLPRIDRRPGGRRPGWLWIATADRVARVNREQLVRGGSDDATVREYGLADGLLGLESVRRHQTVVSGPDGRIWFSMNRGLAVADVRRAAEPALPALAHVEEVAADGTPIDLHGARLIPAGSQRITLNTGLSWRCPSG